MLYQRMILQFDSQIIQEEEEEEEEGEEEEEEEEEEEAILKRLPEDSPGNTVLDFIV